MPQRTFNSTLDHTRRIIASHDVWIDGHFRAPRHYRSPAPRRETPSSRNDGYNELMRNLAGAKERPGAALRPVSASPLTALYTLSLLTSARIAEATRDILPLGSAEQQGRTPPQVQRAGGDVLQNSTFPVAADAVNTPVHLQRYKRVRKRAVEQAAPPAASTTDQQEIAAPPLNGDLPVASSSLIGARVKAAKALLGHAAEGKEDEELLDAANEIHLRAAHHPGDQAAVHASLALFAEEARLWADENGGREFDLPPEKTIDLYLEGWQQALKPLALPHFRSRTQILKELKRNHARKENFHIIKLELATLRKSHFLGRAEKLYYEQFENFIKNDQRRLVTARALENAETAGLKRILMEYRPEHIWIVKDIALHRSRTWYQGWKERPLGHLATPSFFFPMPDGRFGMVGSRGEFKFIDHAILDEDGNLEKKAVLRALGIKFATDLKKFSPIGCPKGQKLCHIHNFDIADDFLEAESRYLSVKNMMEARIRDNYLYALKKLKEEKYEAGVLETALKIIVPFYETIRKSMYDPTYELSLQDIAWDLVALGTTLTPIGVSAVKSGVVGLAGARAALATMTKGASETSRASIILRALMDSYKTSSFLRVAGRELTDFVLPVFTTKAVATSALKGGKALARKALRARLHLVGHKISVAKLHGKAGQKALTKALQETRETSFAIEDAVRLVGRNPNSRYADETKGFVYRGFVFRGDMRAPEQIFEQGFKLRTEIKGLEEVTGFRGGFGGGKDALDIDGRGISTSPFAMTADGAGADVYGRARGGYTYLVDARDLEGYDLYKNAALARVSRTHGKKSDDSIMHAARAHARPLEINYGTDIPADKVIGAFDKDGKYLPNPAYAAPEFKSVPEGQIPRVKERVAALEHIADFLEKPGQWNDEAGDFAPTVIAKALNRRIEIRDYPAKGHSWHLDARSQTSAPAIAVVYSPGHYDAYIAGRRVAMPADGDCLFRAVLASMHEAPVVSDDAVRDLRRLVAQDIRAHPNDYGEFLAHRNEGI